MQIHQSLCHIFRNNRKFVNELLLAAQLWFQLRFYACQQAIDSAKNENELLFVC